MSEENAANKDEALREEAIVNSAEYDANFDGEISYSEKANMVHPEDDAIVVEDDVALSEDGFEEVPAYDGPENVEPAVDGVPEGAEEAEAELVEETQDAEVEDEDEGFLENLVDESALPEHVKEVLNMDVGDAFREIFNRDEK